MRGISAMMGERLGMQESLFYEFRFEDHVPADHLLRGVDRFVDLSELRRHLAGFYSSTGRPSVAGADDSDVDYRLQLGHPLVAAPLRGGAREPALPLVLPAWASRQGAQPLSLLQEPPWALPRERDLRRLFETVVRSCMEEGLIGRGLRG